MAAVLVSAYCAKKALDLTHRHDTRPFSSAAEDTEDILEDATAGAITDAADVAAAPDSPRAPNPAPAPANVAAAAPRRAPV